MDKKYRKNEQIRGVSRVMLIGSEGVKPEIMLFDTALRMAYDKEMDLVEIGPNQNPPVVKIMDYGAFLYHESKKAQENAKKNKELEVKEIRFRPVTDDGDFQTKSKQIAQFLEKGHKVRVAVRFKGREFANVDAGFKMMERLVSMLQEEAQVETAAKMDGKQMLCILAPNKRKASMGSISKKDDLAEKSVVSEPSSVQSNVLKATNLGNSSNSTGVGSSKTLTLQKGKIPVRA